MDFAVRHRALIVVQDRDWESLPEAAREQVRGTQRAYVDLWATTLRHLRPDLAPAPARAMAHAAFGLINSTPHSGLLPDEEMRELLAAMATRALQWASGHSYGSRWRDHPAHDGPPAGGADSTLTLPSTAAEPGLHAQQPALRVDAVGGRTRARCR